MKKYNLVLYVFSESAKNSNRFVIDTLETDKAGGYYDLLELFMRKKENECLFEKYKSSPIHDIEIEEIR